MSAWPGSGDARVDDGVLSVRGARGVQPGRMARRPQRLDDPRCVPRRQGLAPLPAAQHYCIRLKPLEFPT